MIRLNELLFKPTSIAPLVTFRIFFGGLMAFGAIRFWASGWIEKLFLEPTFFFKFYGFEWAATPGAPWIYVLFAVVALSATGIMLGFLYRISTVLFFLSFTYTELLDATNYLNHYYLVCLLAFMLLFLPAHRAYSVDVWLRPQWKVHQVPSWCIHLLLFQLCCVYFFAGLAKVNPDWLWRAMPMAIWLPERADLPVLGYFFQYKWVAYVFSWAGALYDLTIWFFLLRAKTRPYAYLLVVVFHLLTYTLFNIGLFPWIMITSTLLFFSPAWHERLQGRFRTALVHPRENQVYVNSAKARRWIKPVLLLYVAIQVLLPLRHWLYPGDVLWTEEGYRFSWRVMLVEKNGMATFWVRDSASGRVQEVVNGDYLTFYQEKQMSIQPDFILQFAHFLKKEYETRHGFRDPIVTVDAHVAMNGQTSRRYITPDVNLASIKDSFAPKTWILK